MAVHWGLPLPVSFCAWLPPACRVCSSPPRDALAVSLRLSLFVSASLQPMNDPLNGPTDPVCSHLPLPLLPFPAKPFSPTAGRGGGCGLSPCPSTLPGWGRQAWAGMERARQRNRKARGEAGGGGARCGRQKGERRGEEMGATEMGKEKEKGEGLREKFEGERKIRNTKEGDVGE